MTQNRMLGAWRPCMGALLAASLVAFGAYPPVVSAAAPITADAGAHAVNIPAGSLVDALERVAKQFGLELVYDADQLKGIMTPGVSGHMTAMEAVHQLLKGENLRLIEHPDGAILVMPPAVDDRKSGAADSMLHESRPDGDSADVRAETRPGSGPTPDAEAAARRDSALKTIVVTGTHIQGETPVGSSLSVHSRDEIERSGSATLEQFGRKMTENYSGTDALATANTNGNVGVFEQGAAGNIFGGAGFNLKGLGPGSTLTLVNGHRLAAGGLDGATVDISQIPLSAIDHIEVLDDGASAIYGSDAVAGVVNIITRHEFEGAETGLRYGRATQGGAVESTASQVVGKNWNDGNAMADYEFDDQGGLDASQRPWNGSQGGPFSLIPENRRQSVYFTGREDIAGNSAISADLLYSDRHFESNGVHNATNALFNDLQQSVGHAAQSLATVGFLQDILDTWTAGLTGNYSSVRQTETSVPLSLAGAAGGSGSQHLTANSNFQSVDTLLEGPLFNLPGGALKVSLGGAYRWENFYSLLSSDTAVLQDSQRRDVASAYGEIIAPFIKDGPPGVRRLELSAAFRYDHYQGFGPTRNPKFGWLWEPTIGLRLKGTGGTSFKAPLLSQLGAPITSYTALFPSLGSGGKDDVLIINGGNPGLDAETATSVTLGLDFEPPSVRGLTTSVNFFWLRFDNRIQEQNILPQPIASQPQLIDWGYNTGAAAVQPYFDSPGFQGDSSGLGPAGVNLIVDNQFANTTSTIERGLHASGRYRWTMGDRQFELWFAGQYLLADLIRAAVWTAEQSVDNTIGEPPKFKGRGGISWTADSLLADLTINHVNAYRNTLFTPSHGIGAWTTADAYLGYGTGSKASHFWDDIQIGLSVQNLFDRKPPFLQIPAAYLAQGRSAVPFDGANASPVGRVISLQFRKRW